MSPKPADGIQYVSVTGNNANDGLTWGSSKASIGAAYKALPSCTVNGKTWPHCGDIKLSAGEEAYSSPIVLDSPFVKIMGTGSSVTKLSYEGTSGCLFEWTGYTDGSWRSGGLFDILIDGKRAGAGTCGIETYDIESFNMRNVTIANFNGSGSRAWWDNAVKWFNERFDVQVSCINDRACWQITAQETALGYPHTTFGFGRFNIYIELDAPGQVGVLESAGHVSFSNVHIIENINNAGTAFVLKNGGFWNSNLINFHFEQTGRSGGTGFSLASGTSFTGIGQVQTGLPNSIDGPFYLISQPIGQINITAASAGLFLDLQALRDATATTAAASPALEFEGRYWNGSTSAKDVWSIKQHINPGTDGSSWLQFSHSGSPGSGAVVFPEGGIILKSADGSVHLGFSGTKYTNISLPPSGGTLALSGAEGVSAGIIALSSGSGSHVFSSPYAIVPVCVATDTSARDAVKVTSSRTMVAVTGTGNDIVSWICTPKEN